jgi:hypothetical protein
MSFSIWRMRWLIAWRAACAAMRPKSRGVTSTSSSSPNWMPGLIARAFEKGI